jgi:hypothetical protein
MIYCLTAYQLERPRVSYNDSSITPESLQRCCCNYACQMSSSTFWTNRDVNGGPIDGASVTLPYAAQLLCVTAFEVYLECIIRLLMMPSSYTCGLSAR